MLGVAQVQTSEEWNQHQQQMYDSSRAYIFKYFEQDIEETASFYNAATTQEIAYPNGLMAHFTDQTSFRIIQEPAGFKQVKP